MTNLQDIDKLLSKYSGRSSKSGSILHSKVLGFLLTLVLAIIFYIYRKKLVYKDEERDDKKVALYTIIALIPLIVSFS